MISAKFVAPLLLAATLATVGCKRIPRDEYEAAIAENTELRERLAAQQDAVRQANDQLSALEQERNQLNGQLSTLQGQLASRPSQSNTGFEGMSGVNVSRRGSDLVVGVAGDVLFASGSATLRSEAKSTLNRIAAQIKSRYQGHRIRIEGHTDSDPIRKSKWGTNERLSAERALAVEEYLATQGISKDVMYIAGMGSADPRGTKAQSRRVEIVILDEFR